MESINNEWPRLTKKAFETLGVQGIRWAKSLEKQEIIRFTGGVAQVE